MVQKFSAFAFYFFMFTLVLNAQQKAAPKGKLFIIGGGDRSDMLVKKLLATAALDKKDYVAILPMSGAEPDTSYYYIKKDLEKFCSNTIANLNFIPDKINNKQWLDSVQHAKLIFITGGDQLRFMKVVLHTQIYDAIHKAYENGSTISGTSAGAAVMSKEMVTGNQLLDTSYHETFNKILADNIEFKEGLGLIDSIIIDQHFIKRSRYNRMISALAKFPSYTCIGIDEGTAIIIDKKKIIVAGVSQVVVMRKPKGLQITKEKLIKFKSLEESIYTDGDEIEIK
ncbi:MAG TPA: cyanophycinase [Puia sp.]|nr:cyanophycinase [Puia sp.]